MASLYYVHTYVGAVFFTGSLWLGRYNMGKSKGTRSIFILLLGLTYTLLQSLWQLSQ